MSDTSPLENSDLHVCKLSLFLKDFEDCKISDFLEFGWTIGYISSNWPTATVSNHKAVLDYPQNVRVISRKKLVWGVFLVLLKRTPFRYLKSLHHYNLLQRKIHLNEELC